jgi:hypothetical protein
LGIVARECLGPRLPYVETLTQEVAVWKKSRNEKDPRAIRQFRVVDVRKRVRRQYPS